MGQPVKFEQRFDLGLCRGATRFSIVRAKSELRGESSPLVLALQSRDAAEFGLRTQGKKECNFSPMVNADPKRASIRVYTLPRFVSRPFAMDRAFRIKHDKHSRRGLQCAIVLFTRTLGSCG